MASYAYRAARADGGLIDGSLEAASKAAAVRELQGQGLTPIRVSNGGGATGAEPPAAPVARGPRPRRFAHAARPSRRDVHELTRELAVMLRAGLPLDRALRVLGQMSQKPAVAALLQDLLAAVKAGSALSQALAAQPALFGGFYLSMVRSGEASGRLPEVLAQLAEHLERMRGLRESVVSALIYPAMLIAVAALSVFVMLAFVVPQFESLFAEMGEALPLPTRMIVGAGHFVAAWGWLVLLAAAAALALLRRWLATDEARRWSDGRLLRLPVLGELVHKFEIARFARSMGTLLASGVAIVAATRIAADTVGNRRLRAAVTGIAPALKQGGRMTEALAATGLFTPLALNMVRLGEETGRVGEMLLELARVLDGEVQVGVKRALALVEPLIILALGAIVAVIIVSILMGILSVNDLAA